MKIQKMLKLVAAHSLSCLLTGEARGQSTEQAIQGFQGNYERYRQIEFLKIHFILKYEHVNGSRNFIFNQAEVETWRNGPKRRLDLRGDLFDGTQMTRRYAWDGQVATGIDARGPNSGEYYARNTPDFNLHHYNYYIDFLSYPEASGSLPSIAKNPEARPWLPDLLVKNAEHLRVRHDVLSEERADCVVLELPAMESFWLDPRYGFALRQRDTLDPKTGRLRVRTTLSDFRLVREVWLPWKVTREEYAESNRPEGLVNRKVLEVQDINTDPIPGPWSRLPAPVGVTVHDVRRKVFFTQYGTGENPVVRSAEKARERFGRRYQDWWLGLIAVSLAALLAAFWTIRRSRRASRAT